VSQETGNRTFRAPKWSLLLYLFHEYLLNLPHFLFWLMRSLSVGSALLLIPYYALIRLFSTRRQRQSDLWR
jgi:hypothetical protein